MRPAYRPDLQGQMSYRAATLKGFYSGRVRVGPAIDEVIQLLEVEGLGEHGAAEVRQGSATGGIGPRVPCHEDDVRRELGSMLVDPVPKLEAAFIAEPEIDECAVDGLGDQKLAGIAEGGSSVHRVTAASEPRGHGPPDSSLVVDVENDRHAIPSPTEPAARCRRCDFIAS